MRYVVAISIMFAMFAMLLNIWHTKYVRIDFIFLPYISHRVFLSFFTIYKTISFTIPSGTSHCNIKINVIIKLKFIFEVCFIVTSFRHDLFCLGYVFDFFLHI